MPFDSGSEVSQGLAHFAVVIVWRHQAVSLRLSRFVGQQLQPAQLARPLDVAGYAASVQVEIACDLRRVQLDLVAFGHEGDGFEDSPRSWPDLVRAANHSQPS